MHTSQPFIAMSHFISFEPLIVPVSTMLLPLCRLALEASLRESLNLLYYFDDAQLSSL